MPSDFFEQIQNEIEGLDSASQDQVLAFVRSLKSRPVASVLLEMAGCMSADDRDAIQRAIEAECERIDPNEW